MDIDWEQVLTEHGPAVWRTVRFLVGNDADARDCYQAVFLDALQFSRHGRVDNWKSLLARFARARAVDLVRKRSREAVHIDAAAPTELLASHSPTAEHALEAEELSARLRACLAELTPGQAEVFVMRYVEQLSYDEIAERTGSTRNAVGVMLNRARKQLQTLLGAGGFVQPNRGLDAEETSR